MNKCNYGLESIKRQDEVLFNALTQGVRRLRDSGTFTTDAIKKSLIMQTIKEHTGMSIILYIEPGWAGHIFPCRITAQHVFRPGYTDTSATHTIIDVTKTTLKGTVDAANARVTGVFSELANEMFLGTDMFKPGFLTDKQIAAIILHELGHGFTYFQFISTIAVGSLIVEQTVNNIFATDNYQEKKIHIKKADEVLGIEADVSIENWVDTTKENLEIILATRFYKSIRSRSTTGYYDVRNCEQLADMFAAKHGAGLELAKANHRLQSVFGMYKNSNFFVHILRETGSLLNALVGSGPSLRLIMLSMDQPKRYDDPKDRIAFIKFHLIDDLKHLPSGNNKTRANIVQDISEIDDILKNITDRTGVLKYIHQTLTSFGKSASKQQQQQKQLEEMLYNNLYFQSAKLKTLN